MLRCVGWPRGSAPGCSAMSGRTAFWRRWPWPTASASPVRIIFHLAGSCRPPAMHAMRRRDELPPDMLWLGQIKAHSRQARRAVSEEAMTQRTKPPFRADMVGSLLRTAPVKQARAQREKGEITAAQLRQVEDVEIEKIIRKQEELGLQLVTDGEFRRAWWHFDFCSMLDGVELYELDHGIQFHGVQTKMQSIK